MEKPLPLSIFVVTKNEAENIRVCLGSVEGLATEIIVVDSGSTDGTPEIAGGFGAKVIHQDWLGFRDQKAFALERCTQTWVLSLDSDEAVSSEMRQSILRFLGGMDQRMDGVIFNRKVRFLGRWITHGDWYPDRKLRLFRRDRGRLIGDATHDAFGVDGNVCVMPGDILHNSYPDIRSYIDKINRYADGHLAASIELGKKWSIVENLMRPFWRFFRAYVLRRGFMDGFPGLWIAVATAFAAFVRYSRLYERQRVQKDMNAST
jgi:glycosyltransferase involved in cell wall biosynthesis